MSNKSIEALCKERGYEIDRCPKTWSLHNYTETLSYVTGDKKYTTIKCDDCGAESTAWERI
jgi:hypothetical protein